MNPCCQVSSCRVKPLPSVNTGVGISGKQVGPAGLTIPVETIVFTSDLEKGFTGKALCTSYTRFRGTAFRFRMSPFLMPRGGGSVLCDVIGA